MNSVLEMSKPVVVSRCAIQEEGNLLVVKRSTEASHNANLWEFPGGKVDEEELLDRAMTREVFQETGLKVEAVSSFAFVEDRIIPDGPYMGRLYLLFCAAGRVVGGDLRLSDEHTEAQWRPFDDDFHRDLTIETGKAAELLLKSLVISKSE